MKTCRRCLILKDITCFTKHKGTCRACRSAVHSARHAADPSYNIEYQKKHSKRLYQVVKQKRLQNPEEFKRKRREEYRASKARSLAGQRTWQQRNPDKVCAWSALRRSALKQRLPKWLTKDQKLQMRELYTLAKELRWLSQEPLEVDHIIPLQGKIVSGLHVPWNLQILPKSMNTSKSNKFYP